MMKKIAGMIGMLILANNVLAQKASVDSSKIGASSGKDTILEVSAYAAGTTHKDTSGITMQPVSALSMTATPLATTPSLAATSDFVFGNLNNKMVSYIKNFYEDNTKHLASVRSKGASYFVMIDKIFQQFGIPEELKYLAVIESGLNTNAVSRVGAVGAWQLMPSTARLLGLRVSRGHDERRDLYKSTTAAAKYLTQLHDMLKDWVLVVAAYNCGPGGMLRAIDESGSNNFWDLQSYLPTESRNHVKKFLATAYIMDRFASFFGMDESDIAGMTAFDASVSTDDAEINIADLQSINISGKYSIPVIAKYLSIDINKLNNMNPGFNKTMTASDNHYTLRLPADKMKIFKANQGHILNESVQLLMESNRQISSTAYPAAKALPSAKEDHNKKG